MEGKTFLEEFYTRFYTRVNETRRIHGSEGKGKKKKETVGKLNIQQEGRMGCVRVEKRQGTERGNAAVTSNGGFPRTWDC